DGFGVGNPHVEICVDSRGGENSSGGGNSAGGGDGFGCSKRAEILVVLDASVKLAEKRAAVPWIVFPGVFAVEEETDRERLIGLHCFSEVPHAGVEVGGIGLGIHSALNVRDEVGQVVIAKQTGSSGGGSVVL